MVILRGGCGEVEGWVYVCVVGLSMLFVEEGGRKERKIYIYNRYVNPISNQQFKIPNWKYIPR